MKLPHADEAVIASEKLHDYLLSPFHPIGAAKAAAFTAVGYTRDGWWLLERDLRNLALINEAEDLGRGPFGQKFIVLGILHGPYKRSLSVTTVWIVRHGEQSPRFVT